MTTSDAPRRVLVAFDKLKGALGAERACEVVAAVIARQRPTWSVDLAPLSDGGDGFARILTRAAGGELHEASVAGPRFEASLDPSESEASSNEMRRATVAPPVRAPIGVVDLARLPAAARACLALDASARRLAVIDMASASGLALVPRDRLDVFWSSSAGTGELLLAARALEVDAILLGVGGSATSDLGLGALGALGLGFRAANGAAIAPLVPALWPHVATLQGDIAVLPPLRIACDVDNPVFGPRGAAAVYGPQKGLRAEQLPRFELDAERVARLLCRELGLDERQLETPGAGAAGGIAFGLLAAVGARLVPGSELVAAWLGLPARVRAADWVLTGEGRFDASSWAGKGPGALVVEARRQKRRVVVFAGSIATGVTDGEPLEPEVCELVAISDPGLPLEIALGRTEENLARSVEAWLGRVS